MTPAQEADESVRHALLAGAGSGLIGGVAFGAAMIELGVLPTVASLVRTSEPVVGLIVHLAIAATVGAGLGLLLRGRWSASETLYWGVAYAAFFWLLGPLTLMPAILGAVPAWDVAAAQIAVPSLIGHVIWGAAAGASLALIRSIGAVWFARGAALSSGTRSAAGPSHLRAWRVRARHLIGPVIRGAVAGLFGLAMLQLVPSGGERMLPPWSGAGSGPALLVAITLGAGATYGLLHPRRAPTAGAAVIRGAGFGILLWVVVGLTLLPLATGRGLDWAIDDARAAFPTLLGAILFGAWMSLGFQVLGRLARTFFSDEVGSVAPDAGVWGPRAVVRGAAAGLVGGLLFMIVMLQVGLLPGVARLVGSGSVLVGLAVHLVIALIVGATYGVLFRRQTFDRASAIGWGVSYGFLWWVIGPLTLAPMILGSAPAWTVAAAAAAFPSLIGHLAFGAGLGLAFHALEERYSPWWISRSDVEAVRMEGRRAEALSAGPALWALLVLVAVLLPVLLAS